MNLLLLQPDDLTAPDRAMVSGRRYRHLTEILNTSVGQSIKTGLLNHNIGEATVLSISNSAIELQLNLDSKPPPPLPLTLILALPRPKMLRRILQTSTAMGIKQIYLINSWRVEKSYWQTPFLSGDQIHQQLLLGLEQAVDTVLPTIQLKKRFKPFVEDELKAIVGKTSALVAHPAAGNTCPAGFNQPLTLAIGPEGGFIDYEIDRLKEIGFQPVTLGQRILRVETAIPAIIGRLYT